MKRLALCAVVVTARGGIGRGAAGRCSAIGRYAVRQRGEPASGSVLRQRRTSGDHSGAGKRARPGGQADRHAQSSHTRRRSEASESMAGTAQFDGSSVHVGTIAPCLRQRALRNLSYEDHLGAMRVIRLFANSLVSVDEAQQIILVQRLLEHFLNTELCRTGDNRRRR